MSADILRLDHINGLSQPFLVRLCGDTVRWSVYDICVRTGLMRIDVCGKLQVVPFAEAMEIIDMDGASHSPDTFYGEEEKESNMSTNIEDKAAGHA